MCLDKERYKRGDSPNAELPRDLGGNDSLGPNTAERALNTMQRQAGGPHPTHEKVDLIIGQRNRTTRCVLDILDAVIQRRIYRPVGISIVRVLETFK